MSFRACEIKRQKSLYFAFHICMPCIWVLRYLIYYFRTKYKRDLFRSLGFNLFHLYIRFGLFSYTESTTCLPLIPYKNLLFTSHVHFNFFAMYDKHSNPLFNGFVAHFNMTRFTLGSWIGFLCAWKFCMNARNMC